MNNQQIIFQIRVKVNIQRFSVKPVLYLMVRTFLVLRLSNPVCMRSPLPGAQACAAVPPPLARVVRV